MQIEDKKSSLIVLRKTPYGSSLSRSALDVALATAAFDQPVNVLFMGDGVLQLLPTQDSTPIEKKNVAKILASLPLYDIETLFADAGALARYNINPAELTLPITTLDASGMRELLHNHDHVLGF
ncbi:MAG: sulfurtransferase complex subunit TusC [Halioglobus sp.]